MPDTTKGCESLESVFINNIFRDHPFPWRMTAAISGAHTLGSAKPENSGHDGHWVKEEKMGVFDNEYYRTMLVNGWAPELNVNGQEGVN